MNICRSLCTLSLLSLSVMAAHDTAIYGPSLHMEHVENSQGACAMVNTGAHLYTAASGRLQVYNLDNPLKPRFVHELKGFSGGRQMAWQGDYLYLTARNFGLWIIDIKDREKPKVAARFDSTELATGIAVRGNLCYVAHRVYGTQILDITNPVKPRHVATVRTREAQTVFTSGKLIFMGDWGSGEVTIADVSNPRQPQILSKTKLDGYGDGLDVAGNLCIASTGHHSFKLGGAKNEAAFGLGHGIELIDISNPAAPKTLSVFKFPKFYHLGNDFWTVRICDDRAYAVDTHNGFFMLDISDTSSPKCLGHAIMPQAKRYDPKTRKQVDGYDCASSVALGDGCVYVTGLVTGLFVIPTPGKSHFIPPARPEVTLPPETPLPEIPGFRHYDISDRVQVRRAALYKDDIIFFACSHAGVKVCKITDNDLTVLKTLPCECAYDVQVYGDRLAVAEGKEGIGFYDIKPDLTLAPVQRYKNYHIADYAQIVKFFNHGKYLAWHGRGSQVYFLNIVDLDNIKYCGKFSRVGILYTDNLTDTDIDGIIACNCGHGSLWLDLNGDTPKQLNPASGDIRIDHNNCAYAALGKQFIIPNGSKFLFFNPKTLDTDKEPKTVVLKQGLFTGQPSVDGNIVTCVCRSKGNITTVDFSDLDQPRILADRCWTDLPCIPDRAIFWHRRLVIPAGPEGVYVENNHQ